MTANASLIRTGRYDEIGALVRRDAALVINRWAKRVVEEQPSASRVHHDVLLDHLPGFLREMGDYLAAAGEAANGCPHRGPARKHGEQRWQVGWSVTEVVRDYQVLRLILLDHLNACLDRPLELLEIQAVGLALDEAIEASVAQYVRSRDEQAEQLKQALLEADRRKDEFLATLAHELRNPLAPLQNSLELIRLADDSPEAFHEAREMMERQVQQMTRLLEDLLDVSKIAQGKLVLHKERLDLRSAIEQAVQTNAPLRQAGGHRLALALPPAPLWVEGDKARLVQVIVNLLNNATAYTPKGGALAVEAESAGAEVVLRVQDNGLGIPPEKLAQIFDMFTQLETGPGRVRRGLGIGLALVRRLVELHGGRITVRSDGAGKGSEFEVRLPAASEPEKPAEPEAKPISEPGRHVLIIEDNHDGRKSLAMLLTQLGHQVSLAEDGEVGVKAATELRPDVVLIDIGLPEMDGYEVASQVRAALGDAVLLVAMTGQSPSEDRGRSAATGINAYLTKPLELKALQALLSSGRTP